MRKNITYLLISSLICPTVLYASPPNLATVSQGLLAPISIANQMLSSSCIILGVGLILGSGIRYREYRRNPQQVRLSTPIFLFVLGVLLVGLPTIARYSPATTAVDQPQAYVKKLDPATTVPPPPVPPLVVQPAPTPQKPAADAPPSAVPPQPAPPPAQPAWAPGPPTQPIPAQPPIAEQATPTPIPPQAAIQPPPVAAQPTPAPAQPAPPATQPELLNQ